MSDITKKIFSIDTDPAGDAAAVNKPDPIIRRLDASGGRPAREPLVTRIELPDDAPLRPAQNAVQPSAASPVGNVFRPTNPVETPSSKLTPIAVTIGLLGLVALAVLAWLYVADVGAQNIGPAGFAAIVIAVLLPLMAFALLYFALRELSTLRGEAARASAAAERLTRAHTTVPDEIATLAQSIRAELTGVEARLERSRAQVEGFAATLSDQGEAMDGTTKVMAERSETVSRALSLHRQAFESLATTFQSQMDAMSAAVDAQRGKLDDTTKAADADLAKINETLGAAATALSGTAESVSTTSTAAETTLRDAEARLSDMADRITRSATELDAVYERRAEHLNSMADRLSGERDTTEAALFSQTEQLSAVDAQLEITEKRLTALVDHTQSIQQTLEERLTTIDATLDAADTRSRDFTAGLTDRVTDSVASARRDLSLMEAELRALQARIDTTTSATLDFEEEQATRERESRESRRIHLQPLESDFPPVEPKPVAYKRAPKVEPIAPLAPELAIGPETDMLDLTQSLEIPDQDTAPTTARDVLRRPAEDLGRKSKGFGRAKAETKQGWRWRDILGGIDAQTPNPAASLTAAKAGDIVRPPAGVPLANFPLATEPTVPPAPQLPDGSDVVARLCEVQLAPSAVVDEGTIIDASRAQLSGGESAQADVVTARLRDPVVHLRGVLAADLEFKLRAESFTRSFSATLAGRDETQLRAQLGSASGRAYLLCLSALR